MLLTYQYRLQPNQEQAATLSHWGELLRRHWNYALGQRLDYLRRTRSSIDRCSLISEQGKRILTGTKNMLQLNSTKFPCILLYFMDAINGKRF